MIPVDLTTPEIYLDDIPYEVLSDIRKKPGLVWHDYPNTMTGEPSGFWVVARHADVQEVSRKPEIFSSAIGHSNLWDLEADALEARRSLIDSDAPDHTRLRRVVSKAFTPKSLGKWEAATRQVAAFALDGFAASGGGDWVAAVAAPLPINVILAILGVPQSDADFLVQLSNYLVEGTGDQPSLAPDAFGNTTELRLLPFASPASHALFEYGGKIGADRRAEPRDDLVTQLVFAEIDGEKLSEREFRTFFQLIVFGGNETTRTALSQGAIAWANNPDQWQLLMDNPELIDGAVEETLRWTTPLLHMRRTAATDTTLADTEIKAGDKVVMWYAGANFDPEVFTRPFDFDITRQDNQHQSFGGGGHHFCLGAYLARMEIRVCLEELLRRGMRLEQRGEPVRIASNFVHGIASLDMGVKD